MRTRCHKWSDHLTSQPRSEDMKKLIVKDGQDLESLVQRTALAAGQAYDRQGATFEAERQAEVALLEKAIELARPGLASVSNAIESAGAHGGKLTDGGDLLPGGTSGGPPAGGGG